CAGEYVVGPHHIECLHARKADDYHLASHGLKCWPDGGMSSTPCTPLIRTYGPGPRRRDRAWQTVPMAQITLRGNPINTVGELPTVGSPAPAFNLTGGNLGTVSSEQFRGKPVLLNIFPSVDTPVCATSVKKFNERAAASGVSVVCVSKDLPFA